MKCPSSSTSYPFGVPVRHLHDVDRDERRSIRCSSHSTAAEKFLTHDGSSTPVERRQSPRHHSVHPDAFLEIHTVVRTLGQDPDDVPSLCEPESQLVAEPADAVELLWQVLVADDADVKAASRKSRLTWGMAESAVLQNQEAGRTFESVRRALEVHLPRHGSRRRSNTSRSSRGKDAVVEPRPTVLARTRLPPARNDA